MARNSFQVNRWLRRVAIWNLVAMPASQASHGGVDGFGGGVGGGGLLPSPLPYTAVQLHLRAQPRALLHISSSFQEETTVGGGNVGSKSRHGCWAA